MIKAILRNHIVRLAEIAESFCSQKEHKSRHWDDKNSGIYNLRWNYRKTILHEEWVCIAPAHLFYENILSIFFTSDRAVVTLCLSPQGSQEFIRWRHCMILTDIVPHITSDPHFAPLTAMPQLHAPSSARKAQCDALDLSPTSDILSIPNCCPAYWLPIISKIWLPTSGESERQDNGNSVEEELRDDKPNEK